MRLKFWISELSFACQPDSSLVDRPANLAKASAFLTCSLSALSSNLEAAISRKHKRRRIAVARRPALRTPAMHQHQHPSAPGSPAASLPQPTPTDQLVRLYRDFLLRQLQLLCLHPAASPSASFPTATSTNSSRSNVQTAKTLKAESTDTSGPSLADITSSLCRTTVASSSGDDDDGPMADVDSNASSDEGFHEDVQKSKPWPPFGADELCNLMNTIQITCTSLTLSASLFVPVSKAAGPSTHFLTFQI